ncbi:MAG: hypothetical protein WDZ31_12425 [Phycisphaeraceae bacterium]
MHQHEPKKLSDAALDDAAEALARMAEGEVITPEPTDLLDDEPPRPTPLGERPQLAYTPGRTIKSGLG